MEQNRIIGFDIIKSLAIFFVVIYHFGCVDFGKFDLGGYFPNSTKIIYELFASSVPLFFMVNGALLQKRRIGSIKIAKYFFLSYFYPVLFYLLIFPALNLFPNKIVSIKTVLISMEFKGVYWFLFSLGLVYIVDAVAQKIRISKVVFILLMICTFITNLIWVLIIQINPHTELPFWGHWGMFTLYSYVYFCLGRNIRYIECTKRWPLLILLLFIGWALLVWEVYVYSNYNRNIYDGVNASFPSLGAMFLSLGFFMLLKDYKIYCSSLGTYFKFIGRNTMGVYVFHIFFVYSYRYFFSTECINPLCAILISFCIVNITAAISELMSKTKLIFFLK